MKNEEKLLPKIQGAPSRYVTWVDYSMRMKQTTVGIDDYELFYRKYYGFIIGFCRKVYNLDDWQISEIISKVFDDFIEKKRFKYDRTKGAFHSWFAKVISNTVKSELKRTKREKITEEKYANDEVEFVEPDICQGDDDNLWNDYLAYLAFDIAVKKSTNDQIHCFTWKYNNKKKPAEIAEVLKIEPTQVSENIRAFKDKVKNAFHSLGASYDQQIDWEVVKQKADSARQKYFEIAERFPILTESIS